jgi:hypothetical protein
MQTSKKCIYHSNKNCFVYFNSNSNTKIEETVGCVAKSPSHFIVTLLIFQTLYKDVIELSYGEKCQLTGYFSALFFNLSSKKLFVGDDNEKLFLNGQYAKKLGIKETDLVTTRLNSMKLI